MKWRANSRVDWAWHGYNLGVTAHYLDGFHEFFFSGREHYVKQTWFFDLQGSYSFNFVAPVEAQPVAGYSKDTRDMTVSHDGQSVESAVAQTAHSALPIWKRLLHDTTVTIGCNNVFGHDPPYALTVVRYPDFLYDSTGRFVYVSLTKKF